MSAYTELAARLRTIVSGMDTTDIEGLEEQSDVGSCLILHVVQEEKADLQFQFIESIKSFLKKHDSSSLRALGHRLQQYSIINLAELDGAILGESSSTQIIDGQWSSLITPPRDLSNEELCDNSSMIGLEELDRAILSEFSSTQIIDGQWPSLMAPPRDLLSNEKPCDNSLASTQGATTIPMDMGDNPRSCSEPGFGSLLVGSEGCFPLTRFPNQNLVSPTLMSEEWNFLNLESMMGDTNLCSTVDNVSLPNSSRLLGCDFDAQSLGSFSSAYQPDLLCNLDGASQSGPALAPVLELLGDFTGTGQTGLAQMKAEEVVQAAKSLIRENLQQFLNTFLPLWQNQGLWGNTNVELLVDSGTSHERLESAYRCLTRLRQRMADDPVRSRMASIVLHREFHAACLMLKGKGSAQKSTAISSQRGRGLATPVIDYTLRRIYKDFDRLPSLRQKELRAEFHDNKRFGKRWERLANSIGYGILIVCSKSVNAVIKKTTFTDAMLDGLAYTVRNHMPDCAGLITELDQPAISLLNNKQMGVALDVLGLNEKLSAYLNSNRETNSVSGIVGKK
ncbi:hypothetical protein O988_05481 [Pseudogymnoascus sp. VKM F-3808]|nr:hypothetical protein O988_05481 [Pseudogymnoascus sp. VKM F-3808]